MSKIPYVKYEKFSIKDHSDLDEKWVQQIVFDDPSILGLGGDLVLKDKERIQPKGGRLDLLFQDFNSSRRYEVEVQLGKTDESHIVRTIEYWDIERKRYPQYEHTAVIVAEDITSRFLNVISLFNGFIPLIAIQMMAVKVGDHISLVCTKVLDQMTLGLEEEEVDVEPADRGYWEKRGNKTTVAMTDGLLDIIQGFAPGYELKYNRYYIGLAKDGQPNNFALFRPQKTACRLEVRLSKSDALEAQMEQAGLDVMDFDKWGRYRIRLTKGDVKDNSEILMKLLESSHGEATGPFGR